MKKTLIFIAFFLLFITSITAADTKSDVPPILSSLQEEISTVLNKMDTDLSNATDKISKVGIQSPEARKILLDLCASNPYAVDCATVDMNGKMLIIEPEGYRKFEGSDISKQEQVIRIHKTKKPILSEVFRSVEGFDAVDLEHPVFSHHDKMTGSVSILIRPESFLSKIITPAIQGLPFDIWVMDKNGRILFDPDTEEIGRNLFEDPVYRPFSQLLNLGKMIAQKRSGSGTYEFLATGLKKSVTKNAHWSTFELHGTEWRIVVVQVVSGDALSAKKGLPEIGLVSHDESLRKFSEDKSLQNAMLKGEDEKVLALFKYFYTTYPGLYSIQWADAKGVNLFGYPKENSLINYDYNLKRKTGDDIFLKAIDEKKETSFDIPLIEGNYGHLFLVPVYNGDEYLGMIYTIRIKP
ncbi:MAG: hypothetical protein A2Y97_01825 [Nitrospirae bacterium RBG_13_39_12]|nr:MAG: hypothetical protein A2Y97_01825 [Nitrospirae bacterium RBG_13_39_12]